MHSQASDSVAPVRCAQCQEIKRRHNEAARLGNRRMVESMIVAMGRHQRLAHS